MFRFLVFAEQWPSLVMHSIKYGMEALYIFVSSSMPDHHHSTFLSRPFDVFSNLPPPYPYNIHIIPAVLSPLQHTSKGVIYMLSLLPEYVDIGAHELFFSSLL